jgi:hypothetical protein
MTDYDQAENELLFADTAIDGDDLCFLQKQTNHRFLT